MDLRKRFFIFVVSILLITTLNVNASMKKGGYQMGHLGINQGEIYSRSAFPLCVETDINHTSEDLTNLHKGTTTARNYMKFVEVGNAGIHQALKKGNLNKASFVTTRVHKINIPIGYLPIYFKETKTVVYGTRGDKL